ncbi:UNVERIFIED_CONTAM: hypothetical protein PYX00_003982 [Menopon gallinae]|uniref:SSD domain-containing protein n=1 Tax=Menopon gallinae TaxID=328185 RepID=A0AAW2I2J5_9NEOP
MKGYDGLTDHNHHDHQHLSSDGFFCDGLSQDYSHVVLESLDPQKSLLTLDALHSVCELQKRLMDGKEMNEICETVSPGHCCAPWSLPNYITLLYNRSDCFSVTEEDVKGVRSLLLECAKFYNNLQLQPDCRENNLCPELPVNCSKFNAVYNILYYLTDVEFLPVNYTKRESDVFLNNTLIFLPIARSSAVLPYYYNLSSVMLKQNGVRVSAMDFGLKNTLFDECLVRDALFMAAGSGFMILCIWSYTGSLFITLCTVFAIGISFIVSYFIYTFIFNIKFFPFMNMLAIVVAIGIGADDSFIFYKMWQCSKLEKVNCTLLKLVSTTLQHARVSMFVTSLTTAAAFYSNFVSSITAINCFSVFAGTAVLVNFFLMVTWLPACFVISERWCCPLIFPVPWRPEVNSGLRLIRERSAHVRALLDRCLILAVIRLRWVWLFVFSSLAIGSAVIILYYPKLRLPDSKNFHLFESKHLFEQYDLIYRDKLWFERLEKDSSWDNTNFRLPLRFVWGVLPVDNGDYLEPNSKGTLQFDSSFDISSPESQVWLLNFCRELRQQTFYQSTLGPLLPNCFIESLTNWMQRRCRDPIDNIDRSPCCETSPFPYTRQTFNTCIIEAMAHLYETPADYFLPGVAGPKFSKSVRGEIKAIVIEYDSNYSYSASFTDMDAFYTEIENWFQKELLTAPPGMKGGWFISELGFYDLQLTLSNGTILSIGVSMAVALAVVFLVSLNVFISFYAVLAITCTIFVTVATLVLLGWRLNVLESVAVTTAIGLSVDFSLHYGTIYRQSSDDNRQAAVAFTLNRMGGPTLMAALTTGAAGIFMLPSSVLPYIQIGIFLIVVMGTSWVYSTVFLMALLSIVGPEKGFGQLSFLKFRQFFVSEDVSSPNRSDKVFYSTILSESTLSTSSVTCGSVVQSNSNEIHELDAITRSRNKSRRSFTSRNSRRRSTPQEQSPTDASGITVILQDELDTENKPK